MKQIFINLPVSDLEKSMQFYLALGFSTNPLFTGDAQKCMVWSDSIYVMLQSKEFANSYLAKSIVDPRKHQMPSFTLLLDSIESVNKMMGNGINAGGIEPVASISEDSMFLRSIEDLDGYVWGILFLDIEKFKSLK